MQKGIRGYCFIILTLIITILSFQSVNARIMYWGWMYNATSSITYTVNMTYNYSSLQYYGYIKNENNIDVYSYNYSTAKFTAVNAALNKTTKILSFQEQGFPKYYRLGENVPYVIANLSIDYLSAKANSTNYKISYILTQQPTEKASSTNYKIKLK